MLILRIAFTLYIPILDGANYMCFVSLTQLYFDFVPLIGFRILQE